MAKSAAAVPSTRSTRRRAWRAAPLLFALVAGACGSSTAASGSGSTDAEPINNDGISAGEPDPIEEPVAEGNVAATSFERLDGSTGAFADFGGKPLVVNFFGKWCPPCVAEMPEFELVHGEVAERVQFVGISVNETVEDAEELVGKTGVTYPIARDPRGALLAEFGGIAMPTTAFVDAEGNVLKVQSRSFTADQLRDTIDEVFPT
ncbi:MAG: TlpA family protein disulfide reductase [Acidimicrobiia bacterium]|nr:TlpA family protein disulfide reductase [Acidimicrobiia bacterium]